MADATHVRILDACVTILGHGIGELSIPAVAREAGVSVPTVYRNFKDKKTLIEATADHLRQLRGIEPFPAELDELPAFLRRQYANAATISETVRAAIASEPIMEIRAGSGGRAPRVERMTRLLAPALRGVDARTRAHVIGMVTVLCSSATLRAFLDLTRSSPEEAADTVSWVIARLLGRSSLATPARRRTR
jgi:AcrR family transcriptional regulator